MMRFLNRFVHKVVRTAVLGIVASTAALAAIEWLALGTPSYADLVQVAAAAGAVSALTYVILE